jgi:manganese/zinc/iron transport system permease protein
MNPYTDTTFWTFFSTPLKRIFLFVKGEISFEGIATDEVQLIVLALVGGASAILGTWLTFRRMAMLANALSHTLLLGIVGAFLLYRAFSLEPVPTLFSVPFSILLLGGIIAGIVTALLTESLRAKVGIQEDASIGIVFTAFFALSLLIINLTTRNAHIGVDAIIGNVDALQKSAIFDAIPLFLGVFIFETLFRKELLATTFDAPFALGVGIPSGRINFLLMGMTALLLTLAFQAVGVIQVLAFLVIPPLFAGRLSHSIPTILKLGILFAILVAFIGVALSRHLLSVYSLPVSTGSLVVTLQALFLAPLLFLKKLD